VIPWRSIFQRLAAAYQWTPAEVVELTPPQLTLLLTESVSEPSAVAMSMAEGTAYVAHRRAQRETWVNRVLETRRTNVVTTVVPESRSHRSNSHGERPDCSGVAQRSARQINELQHAVASLAATTCETQRTVERLQKKPPVARFG